MAKTEYEPKVLYETAYNLHYKQYDLEMALDKYKEVIERFPDTPEAGYAETQIENIQDMSDDEKKVYEEKRKRRKVERKENEQTVLLTTSYYIEGKSIVEHKGIISAEAVMGVNIFRDMFSEIRDVIGGRSASYQKELRKAKELVLDDLRDKAYELGANAVIGVDLDYNQLSARDKSSLMVVANGTAVVVEDEQNDIRRTNELIIETNELLSKLLDKISNLPASGR